MCVCVCGSDPALYEISCFSLCIFVNVYILYGMVSFFNGTSILVVYLKLDPFL